MTDLLDRLADANPVRTDDLAPSIDALWRGLESTALPHRELRRLPPPHRRGVRRWAVVGTAAVAVAVAVLILGTTGGGPPKAFAGWTATPTTPANGQLQAAEVLCHHQNPSVASLTPTVTDVRGPYSMLVWAENGAITFCAAGAQGTLMSGGTTIPSVPTVAPGAIEPESSGFSNVASPQGEAASMLDGEAGANVSAVTLTLDDGSTIQTTVANDWFAAWWPGSQGVQSAEITTASGTTTQPLDLSGPRLPPGVALSPTASSGASGAGASGASAQTPTS